MKTYAPKPEQKHFLDEEEEAGLPDWIVNMSTEEREQAMEAWRRQVGIKKNEKQEHEKTEAIQDVKSAEANSDKLTTALKEIDAYEELNSVEKRLNTSFLSSLSALGEFELLKMDTAHRVKALKHLSEFVYLGGDAEQCVVMLLDRVPVGEENAVLRNMISSRRFITFEDKIQGDNYKAYHLAVRRLYLSAKSLEQAEKEISAITGAGDTKHPKTMERFAKEDHLFWWLDSGFVNKIVHHGHWVDYSNMTFTKEGQLSFDMQYWHGVGADPKAHIELDPFTMVGVIFKSASQGMDFNASEEIKYMPALNLFALYTEQWNAEAMRAVDTSLLIAGGIGMLSKTTRLGKLVALLDVSLGATAIVINELRPKISDTEEGKQFLKVWDTVNGLIGIYGLAKVISHLPQVFTKLKETYKKFKKKSGQNLSQTETNKLDTEIHELIKNADNTKIGLETELTFSEGVKERFIKHFNSGERHADLKLPVETMASKAMNLIENNISLLKEGDNTLIGNINGIQKSFKAFVKDGKIITVNMYPGSSNRITLGTIINIGNVKW